MSASSQTDPKQKKSNQTSEEFLQELSELSDEVKVRKLASLFFSITDIAVYLDRDPEQLRQEIKYDPDSWFAKAYKKGVMDTTIQLRYDTHRFALAGNPQAEEEMKSHYARLKLDENA